MSSEREEIRWELDKIFEFVNWLITLHQSEQKLIWEQYEKTHSGVITARNSIIAGIGFGIGVIIGLISIGELERTFVDFLVYGLIGAGIVFIGMNVLLYFVGKKYQLLYEAYGNDILALLELKGWLLGGSIKDRPQNKEQIVFLAEFTYVISIVIGHNIQLKIRELFKEEITETIDTQKPYVIAKKNLEHYKKIDLRIIQTIEKFIDEFEKNKKSNS